MKSNQVSIIAFALVSAMALNGCGVGLGPRPALKPQTEPANKQGDTERLPGEGTEAADWFTKGPADGVQGVDVEAVYKKLDLSRGKEIVVAVIDSGVDVNHEDLQGRIWVNEKEANGKPGVDDDGNGYIDDINGWSFLGGKDQDGKIVNIGAETLEVTRELVRLRKLKAELEAKGEKLSEADAKLFETYGAEVASSRAQAEVLKAPNAAALEAIRAPFEVLKEKIGDMEKIVLAEIEKLETSNDAEAAAKAEIIKALKGANAASVARLRARVQYADDQLNYYYNEAFNPRAEIVKDNPNDFNDVNYGVNDVTGPDADHGTHVSGIIGAVRDNGLGIKGIATNVKIMALRAVPNGDERDKDIALAVRYAADNGANIINMSFGKSVSPGKGKIDEAFLYAANKGVLIVHAAGNSSEDIDTAANFPNRNVLDPARHGGVAEIPTWLEIGASSQFNDQRLTAVFSNYGKKNVDVFAPGVDLNSTTPGNTYSVFSGTSMACPAAAGVAAVIWSQNPELSASQVKAVLLKNARDKADLPVLIPGTMTLAPYGTLSQTGGEAEVFSALRALGKI
ncbi:MAG: S8 family serine peptidase [Bacteriovoracia bacterium]